MCVCVWMHTLYMVSWKYVHALPQMCGCLHIYIEIHTLNSAYNEKKYMEIFHHYKWLFIKGDIFIGEWGIFGTKVFFIIANFSLKETSL